MKDNIQQNRLVPELRFAEFENTDNGWNETKLIDVTDKNIKWSFIGGPFGSNLKSSDYVSKNNGVRIIQLQNIGDGEFKNDYKIFTSKEKADELLSNNIYPGEIIMSKMGDPVGRACIIPDFHDRYVMGSDGIRIVVDENKYDKYFIYLLINSKTFRTKVKNSSTGSTRKRIGLVVLKNLSFLVPQNKKEQQKIANTLSSLDDLLQAETERLALLKEHKKGLLQQLFPKQGEKVPQLRFEEFVGDGDWEEKELGDEDVAIIIMGSSPKSSFYNENNIGLPLLQGNADIKNRLSTPRIFTSQITKECQIGDILLSVRAPVGTVAKSLHKACIGRGISAIRAIKNNSQEYLYQWLISFEPYWKNISQGGTFDAVNSDDIRKLHIPLPNPKEQQKIADTLTSVDELIAAQSKKITALKEHKKGLMQGMFPKIKT